MKFDRQSTKQKVQLIDQHSNMKRWISKTNLDVFEKRKTLTPLDNLIEAVISNAAQTGQVVSVRSGGGGIAHVHLRPAMQLSFLLIAVPQMLDIHNLEQQLWHRRPLLNRARRRRARPLDRIHRSRTTFTARRQQLGRFRRYRTTR